MNASQEPKQSRLRLRDKRRRLAWVKVAAGSSVVAVALFLVWYVARLPELTIADVAVSGDATADEAAIKDVAASKLAGSYFFLVPKANALIFPRESITAAIANAFPEVAEVSIVREGLTTVRILLSGRSPVALWCDANDNCYLMDKNGFVYAKATSIAAYIRFYGLISEHPIGKTYLADGFASLKSFVEEVSSTTRRTPASVTIEENGDVLIAFLQGGVLKFVLTADRGALLNNIASVFSSSRFDTAEKLEYADFRFGDKVYVKFIEE